MTDPTVTLLDDAFDRVADLVRRTCSDLDDRTATFRIDPEANTPAWLLWHLTRVQDDHVAELAGVDQAWEQWRDRFSLPFDDHATGYGQSSADVGAVRVSPDLLAGYHADVDAMTRSYVRSLDEDELARVVDDRWDPPVTASARLVSVLGDCLQHLGQAAFVAGVATRS